MSALYRFPVRYCGDLPSGRVPVVVLAGLAERHVVVWRFQLYVSHCTNSLGERHAVRPSLHHEGGAALHHGERRPGREGTVLLSRNEACRS